MELNSHNLVEHKYTDIIYELKSAKDFEGNVVDGLYNAWIYLNNPSQYNYRFLDIVKVKGKSEAVYIFEVIDGDSDDVKQLKMKTKDDFANGVNLYKSIKFKEALEVFEKVNQINPHDQTAELYITRCKNFIEHGVPEDWDGIQSINWNLEQ